MTTAARATRPKTNTSRKGEVIQIRASAEAKAIINRAAAVKGQTLSEFVLYSARQAAEEALLDQRVFFLDPEAHEAFLALLDAPMPPSAELRALVARKKPWEG